MNREEALKQLDEMAIVYVSIARLTRSMSNTPAEVVNKINYTNETLDYIKENLK